jgi:coatomer subunit beta
MIDDDKASTDNISSKLSRITQLTGFSDPVYAEAFIQVNKFDIVLDILLVNQTAEVLQNLSLEFAVLGDLKLLDRPVSQTLAAHSFLSIQATVKVSSADAGVIFGSIVYDRSGSIEQEIVILNDIHIDVMDYIKPAICTENQFRSMWTEFEWENKVNINSRESDLTLREYLKKLMERTNMSCLTPEASLKGDCSFLSANLYAKSTFGNHFACHILT